MTSSPLRPGASSEEERDYWKGQFETLQIDLSDFQSASKDIEEQLEKDIEASEKSERKLKEHVENLGFQVDEWKAKHKQAKAEANNAQNALQKEITTMREQNRAMSLQLRDIEVANDDYETQARNTSSSLEDMESKLNVSIERGVLMEEEIKVGEQEREGLRIEAQRLRDELGDLKVESEIRLEKLRLAESTIEGLRARKPSNLAVENLRARSPASEASGITSTSFTASTPPPRSDSASDAPTPPSPPLSDAPAHVKSDPKTPVPTKRKSLIPDVGATPRAALHGPRVPPSRHIRGPSLASSISAAGSDVKMKPPPRTRPSTRTSTLPADMLPRSESLMQMKSLRSRMQKIEERVQTARSKLPPLNTTPRGSPRGGSALGHSIPSSITVRRTSKRPSNIATPSALSDDIPTLAPSTATESRPSSRRDSHIKRLSYGIARTTTSSATNDRPPSSLARDRPPSSLGHRPSSSLSHTNRPPSRDRPPSSFGMDRPPSSFSMDRPPSSAGRPSSRLSLARPESRTGARTPLTSSFPPSVPDPSTRRPRSSIGGTYSTAPPPAVRSLHRSGASVSELRRTANESALPPSTTATAGIRRTTLDRSGITPALGRRQSGGIGIPLAKGHARRISGVVEGGMRPPPSRRKREEEELAEAEAKGDLGETY